MHKFKKNGVRSKKSAFSYFLLISLLLHLLAGLALQLQPLISEHKKKTEDLKVDLQERTSWLELDQTPQKKSIEPPEAATHIAETNQQVKKEMAPKGDDSRDKISQPKQVQKPAQQTTKNEQNSQQQAEKAMPISPALPEDDRGDQILAEIEKQREILEKLPIILPSLKSLTNLAPNTLTRLDQQQQRQRNKDRPEIELKDDEVWLNLRQDDKLISFFRRFSDRIEAVWNYPVEASSKGIEGTLLIKIIVNKKGELVDAFPLESSGSEILDYEAITAVYRAAPFGDLPSYYKHDQLKIYAHFQYSLSRRMLYGRPR